VWLVTRTVKTLGLIGLLAATAAGGAWVGRALTPPQPTPTEAPKADADHATDHTDPTLEPAHTESEHQADDSHSVAEPQPALSVDPPAETDAEILARVEQLIRDGSCRSAVSHLARIDLRTTTASPGRIWFLQGFCHEGLSEYEEARIAYEHATNLLESPSAARQARLSHARVLHLSRKDELVSHSLYRELLTLGAGDWDDLDADTVHLLAAALSVQAADASHPEQPFADDTLFTSRARLDARRSLEPPVPTGDAHSVDARPDQLRLLQRFGPEPQQVYIEWRAAEVSIVAALQVLGELLGRPIHWSQPVERHLSGRHTRIDVSDIDVSLVLDALLTPIGLTWSATEDQIEVLPSAARSAEEVALDRRERAERALQWALARAAVHPWAATSYNSLALLQAGRGALDEALQLYAQSRELTQGRHSVEADLNEGKLALQLRDRRRAMQSFYRCVDSVDAHPLKLVAYGYLGRLQLEDGASHEAISALQRAVALAEKTEHLPLLTLQLAAALLLDDNPGGANSLLVGRRELFTSSELAGPAAFIAAYARYRAATVAELREREATNVIQTLAQVDPARLFGGHWWILAAEAYRTLGMTPDAERIAEACLQATSPFPRRDQMMRTLLPTQLTRAATSSLPDSASALLSDTQRGLGPEARLQAAQAEYRRGLDAAALERAQALVADAAAPQTVRAAALRLLGHIYQQRGNHAAAIQCFSGVLPGTALPPVPLESLAPATRTEGHP
jgi:tetratricopeptide (TPR) repeat protein